MGFENEKWKAGQEVEQRGMDEALERRGETRGCTSLSESGNGWYGSTGGSRETQTKCVYEWGQEAAAQAAKRWAFPIGAPKAKVFALFPGGIDWIRGEKDVEMDRLLGRVESRVEQRTSRASDTADLR
jgi:hypothetical protein